MKLNRIEEGIVVLELTNDEVIEGRSFKKSPEDKVHLELKINISKENLENIFKINSSEEIILDETIKTIYPDDEFNSYVLIDIQEQTLCFESILTSEQIRNMV